MKCALEAGGALKQPDAVRSLRVVGRYTGRAMQQVEREGAGEAAAVIIKGADGRILAAARI